MGTVELNAIGMFGRRGGWSIARKPGVVEERIEIRDSLSLTINFDHDMIDGAPAARFTRQLSDLIESGYGLDDLVSEPEQVAASERSPQ